MRQWKRALADLDVALAGYPDDLRIQGRRAAPLRGLGRPAEALDALRIWIATGRASSEDLGFRCSLAIELGALNQAGRACTAALEAGWDSSRAFVDLSTARRKAGDLNGAVDALDLAVDAGVTDPVVLYNRAVLRLHLNRPEETLQDLEALLGQVPDHGDGWHLKALALAKLRQRGEAIGAARRASELGADGAAELLQYLKDGGLIDEVKLF
jgi:tetratricopeptide (TPR) repeat protein